MTKDQAEMMHRLMANSKMVKHKATGKLYEIDHVIHSKNGVDGEDVYACHKLSEYDGMPIGPLVYLKKVEVY